MLIPHVLRVVILVWAIGCAVAAIAASPREDFESASVLANAVTEIKSMNQDQLEALIDYMANCNPPPITPEREFACERATIVVRVKTAQSMALARIRQPLAIVDKLIQWHRPGGTSDRVAKDIERRVDVFGAMVQAAAERYHQLSASNVQR